MTMRKALASAIAALNKVRNFTTPAGIKSYDLILELEKVLKDAPDESQKFHVYRVDSLMSHDLLFTVDDFNDAMLFISSQPGRFEYDGNTIGKFSAATSGVYVGLNRGPVED